jgi:hypothetical protein
VTALDRDLLGIYLNDHLAGASGSLKLNGRILSRSPLSDVLEVEALWLAVEAKAAGWRLLRGFAEQLESLDTAQLDRLVSRATRQAEVLEDVRVNTAQQAFAARPSG